MSAKERGRHFRPVKFCLCVICLAVMAYAGLIVMVWIRELSVPRTAEEAGEYDTVIVLGAQVLPDGTPNVQLAWRLDAAVEAYLKHPVPVVVCGAQGKDEPLPEAVAMKQYLIGKGVAEADILMDPDSFNTRQNLENAASLLRDRGDARRVLIVTSDYHVPRSIALAEDLGYEASGLGSPCKRKYWFKNHAREALAWVKYWGMKYLRLPLE